MIDHSCRSQTIVLLRSEFRPAVRSLMLRPGSSAVAPIRRRDTPQGRELLVGPWKHGSRLPDGHSRPPLEDFCVMAVRANGPLTPQDLISQVQPKRSHTLVALQLDPQRPDQSAALLWNEGHLASPERVLFVGPEPFTIEAGSTVEDIPSLLAEADDLRTSRTRGALGTEYDRLRERRVLLVGAGRGGSQLALALVAAGVRQVTLVDHDTLGPENLDAMPFCSPTDVGRPKVELLGAAIVRNQPEAAVSCIASPISSGEGLHALRDQRFDLVATFVDSPVARLAAAIVCNETLTTHLDIGTLVSRDGHGRRTMTADIRLFEPRHGCAACVPRMEQLDEALYELAAPPGSLHRGPRREWHELRSGSLLHLNTLACSVAVETWLAYLAGAITTSTWRRVLWTAGGEPEFLSAAVDADPDCRFCRDGLTEAHR